MTAPIHNNGAFPMSGMADDDARALRCWAVELALSTVEGSTVAGALVMAAQIEAFVSGGVASVPGTRRQWKHGQGRAEVWKLYEQGLSTATIAITLGMSVSAVRQAVTCEKKARGIALDARGSAAGKASAAARYAAKGSAA